MNRFAATCGAVVIAGAIVLVSSAQAQPYGACEPERVINTLASAVLKVAPLFVKPKSQPAAYPIAQSDQQPPGQGMTREQWKQALIEGGRRFCAQYPDDEVCQR